MGQGLGKYRSVEADRVSRENPKMVRDGFIPKKINGVLLVKD